MTSRQNTWLLQDEGQQHRVAAVRSDTVMRFLFSPYDGVEYLTVMHEGRPVWLGACRAEHRARMAADFLNALRRAEESSAGFVVIAAVPQAEAVALTGEVVLWRLYEDTWPAIGSPPAVVSARRRVG